MNPGGERNELYEMYALGLLEEPERSRIEEALRANDPDAVSRLRRALETNALLGTLAEPAEPPKRLRQRIVAIAKPEQPRWAWNLAWIALSTLLLVGLIYLSVERHNTEQELASARDALEQTKSTLELREATLEFLRRPDTRLLKTGSGTPQQPVAKVFVNSAHGVLLVATNLPRLEAGRAFEMWIVPKVGAPRPAGVFRARGDGGALHMQAGAVNLNDAAAIALSVEPEGGSPQPTTTPFLITPVAE